MNTYTIRRRDAWASFEELQKSAQISGRVGKEMSDQVRWIRSYVVREESGRLGTVCVYQATSPDAIREHARRAGMPVHEINAVEKTVIMREDPAEAAA